MKVAGRITAAMVCLALFMPHIHVHALSVSAKAAVLLCAETGETLYARHERERLPMASTTKIMTALLAIEEGTPEKTIIVTRRMTDVEGTSMGLLPGDQVTLRGLVAGMLLSSGNDAANAAAIAIAGSTDVFAERMNARAAEIGMWDTHFVTPSGLDDEQHYTTAMDMALLTREALRNPQFRTICSASSLTVSFGNPPYRRTLTNHNRLLRSYSGCIGVKTGFTQKSGRCLVSAARRNGVTLIAVTLSDPDDWDDHEALLDYGFSLIKPQFIDDSSLNLSVPVVGGLEETIRVGFTDLPHIVQDTRGGEVYRQIYLQHFLYAPVSEGTVVGRVDYFRGGVLLCSSSLVTQQDIPAVQRELFCDEDPSWMRRWRDRIKGELTLWRKKFAFKSFFRNAVLHPDEKPRN